VRGGAVARKYAETLFELARREEAEESYGEALDAVAELLQSHPRFRLFLDTPRIEDDEKKRVVRSVFEQRIPRHVLNFVLVTIDRRRQRLLPEIAREYSVLVDEHLGRQHVEVTLARSPDDGTREAIGTWLSEVLGREAIPHVSVNPRIIGGLIVRTGDTMYDGSVRRRLERMRKRMLRAELSA